MLGKRSVAFALLLVIVLARAREAAARPNTVYVEMLGKGGLWGAGYDRQLTRRFGAGVAVSFYIVDGERVSSLSPYLAAYLVGRQRHRWFVHAGPQVVRVSIPSPVPEWDGTSSTGIGGELSTGWEYRNGVVVRIFAMAAVGKGGLAPWLGVSLGWSL